MTNLIGQSLGRYHILEQLGEGGMAVVYKALDARLDRNVAIKMILPHRQHSAKFLARFHREATTLAKLSHPNILKIFDYGEFDGQPYLVMEYIPGGTLAQKLNGKALAWQGAARFLTRIARALEAAHALGIIHRDIKPANILIAHNREPLLSDFGIAKLIQGDEETADLTGTGVGIGTPEYMAPEQGFGRTDERSDIYALGVIFYEMVTGHKPYRADTPMAVMLKKNTEPLPRPTQYVPNLPPAVENVLVKALARDPEQRYPSMTAFTAALTELETNYDTPNPVSDSPSTTVTIRENVGRVPPKTSGKEKRSRNWTPWAVGAGILSISCVAIIIGAAFWPRIFPTTISPTTHSPSPVPAVALPSTNAPLALTLNNPSPTPPFLDPTAIVPSNARMVLIPAGEFGMGINQNEHDKISEYCISQKCSGFEDYYDATPFHQASLDSFYMDVYEVTNMQYSTCVNAGACDPLEDTSSYTRRIYYGNPQYDNYPVIYVDWNRAKTFCEWRGARLPTEAEWEKAARGTDGRIYPWGDDFQCQYGNFDDETSLNSEVVVGGPNCDGYDDTAPVGSYEKGISPYGVYDMAGNVWEWVADWFQADFYESSPFKNPLGPDTGQFRVMRGSSWTSNEINSRISVRNHRIPKQTSYGVGFRCAQDAP